MMDFSASAAGAYGYQHGANPVGDIMAETSVGANADIPFSPSSLGIGTSNPLFWLLLLALIFTGWVFGAFDFAFGVKKVGNVGFKAKAGR
jgi:hypothetical protein